MSGRGPSFTEAEAKKAIAASLSWAESLRRLGLCPTGGAWLSLKKYAEIWEISTGHFNPRAARIQNLRQKQRPLSEVLVANSHYPRKDVSVVSSTRDSKSHNVSYVDKVRYGVGDRCR